MGKDRASTGGGRARQEQMEMDRSHKEREEGVDHGSLGEDV